MAEPARLYDLTTALRLRGDALPHARSEWTFEDIAGRLVELSGDEQTACLTLAFGMVLEAQRHREPVAWITTPKSMFFAPDVAAGGVDLDAVVVVRVPEVRQFGRAADHLVRSGAFGLIVLDFEDKAILSTAAQSRLLGLAQKQQTAFLFLTRKPGDVPSLGSLVALRGHCRMQRAGEDRFTCELSVLKDKRRAPGWDHAEVCRGPAGLH
jgi:recombination protein RecA